MFSYSSKIIYFLFFCLLVFVLSELKKKKKEKGTCVKLFKAQNKMLNGLQLSLTTPVLIGNLEHSSIVTRVIVVKLIDYNNFCFVNVRVKINNNNIYVKQDDKLELDLQTISNNRMIYIFFLFKDSTCFLATII